MTFTYDGAPGTDTAAERRDAVRFLVGDTDTNDQLASDEEIAFALSQASNDVYSAGAITARAIAGKFARLVDTSVESVRAQYSSRSQQYYTLAQKLSRQSSQYGSSGLGTPRAGGISQGEMRSVRSDDDRVDPAFRIRQFRNPQDDLDDDGEITR